MPQYTDGHTTINVAADNPSIHVLEKLGWTTDVPPSDDEARADELAQAFEAGKLAGREELLEEQANETEDETEDEPATPAEPEAEAKPARTRRR